jgi:serine/threonine protein kinase
MAALDADAELEPDLGGKYRMLLELGQGGTATVHLAVARGPSGFNKLVVLKVPRPQIAADPSIIAMFANEARLSARLNHPNIVQTNEIADVSGCPVIVMEYLEGKPLSDIVARTGAELSLWMHLRILIDALNGLHYAHEARDFDGASLNVVHRDMTPHNVFVTYDGQVKILDFGIAKLERSREKTDTGVIKGKLRYMPPEQVAGEDVDRRADIYAVGVMLWEAAVGKPFFDGERERVILSRLMSGDIPTPSGTKPDVDPELEKIIVKALAPDPEDRFDTAAELQAELEGFLERHASRVTQRELGKFVAATFANERAEVLRAVEARLSKVAAQSWAEGFETTGGTGSKTGTRALRRSKRGWIAGIVGGALCVGLLSWAAWRQWRAPTAVVPSTSAPIDHSSVVQQAALATEVRSAPLRSADPPKTVATVALKIDVTPANARVWIDDVLQSAPYELRVVKEATKHTIRAEAQGYTTATKTLVFDGNVEVRLSLTPAVPGIAPPPPVASPPADCNPPYTFDEKGIKVYKPQCIK